MEQKGWAMWPCSEREGALRWKFQPHCLLSRLLSVSGPQFPRLYNGDSKAQLSRADVLPGTLCARHLTPGCCQNFCCWAGGGGRQPLLPGPLELMQARAGGGWRRAGPAGPTPRGREKARSGGLTDVLWLRDELENSEIGCHHHLHLPSLRPKTGPPCSGVGPGRAATTVPSPLPHPRGARLQALGQTSCWAP